MVAMKTANMQNPESLDHNVIASLSTEKMEKRMQLRRTEVTSNS